MEYIIAIIIGYLLGTVNPAYLIGRIKGFDIRERGSKNAGASNAKICLGWKWFFVVVVYDASKAMLAALIVQKLYPGNDVLKVLAGCSAVFGHCYPFYLSFRGGKGFASYIGLALILNWKIFVVILAVAVILALLTNYIVTATVIVSVSVPIMAWYSHYLTLALCFLLMTSAIILFRHRGNFVRLLKKQEIGINGKPVGFEILK